MRLKNCLDGSDILVINRDNLGLLFRLSILLRILLTVS